MADASWKNNTPGLYNGVLLYPKKDLLLQNVSSLKMNDFVLQMPKALEVHVHTVLNHMNIQKIRKRWKRYGRPNVKTDSNLQVPN